MFYVYRLTEAITRLETTLQDHGEKLNRIHRGLEHLAKVQREKSVEKSFASSFGLTREQLIIAILVVIFQSILTWLLCRK